MAGKGKGKCPHEQISKGGSSVSAPEKRTSRAVQKNNNTIQTTISEWVMYDEATLSKLTEEHINS